MRASVWVGALLECSALVAHAVPAAAQTSEVVPEATTGAAPVDPQPAGQSGEIVNGRRVFDRAFFQRYAPANALEIVRRVPAFALEQVDETLRGFGQAAGNVVINGQRPSTKSDTIETVLQRIPANRVLRIEVGAGDLFGADFAGKPQVVNLVLTTGGGLAGTVEGSLARDFLGRLYPSGSASALIRSGPSTFNVAVAATNNGTTEEGYDILEDLPSGERREFRDKVNRIRIPGAALSGSWTYDGGANRTAHVNGRIAQDHVRLDQTNTVTPRTGPVRDDTLKQDYQTDSWELGGDVTRPLLGGGFKLVGLATRRQRFNYDNNFLIVNGRTIGGFEQTLDDRREETVLRTVWSRANWGGWNLEMGGEGVLNKLVSDVDLFSFDAQGLRSPIDLPVDQATVEEKRVEAFVNAGRPLAPGLRVDGGVTLETSQLTVTGDAEARRVLTFLKPQATLDWRPVGSRLRVQFSVKRTVAQLQFEDFISSAELSTERVNGGNPELRPQRAWETLATVERTILGDGLIRMELGYNRISQVQDRVPTPDGFDAPGNLGSGTAYILRHRFDAPLGGLGIKGGRLTLYSSLVSTSVRDPYTGEKRRFSGNSDYYAEATFRQDLGRFAWGVTAEGGTRSTFYRLNEEDSNYQQIPYLEVFAEYRPDPLTVLTFTVENAAERGGGRERYFYVPDRRTPEPSSREMRFRNRHLVPSISLKRTFG